MTHISKQTEEMQQLIDLSGEELFVAGKVLDRHGLLAEFNRELEHQRKRDHRHGPISDGAFEGAVLDVLDNGKPRGEQARLIEQAFIRKLGME